MVKKLLSSNQKDCSGAAGGIAAAATDNTSNQGQPAPLSSGSGFNETSKKKGLASFFSSFGLGIFSKNDENTSDGTTEETTDSTATIAPPGNLSQDVADSLDKEGSPAKYKAPFSEPPRDTSQDEDHFESKNKQPFQASQSVDRQVISAPEIFNCDSDSDFDTEGNPLFDGQTESVPEQIQIATTQTTDGTITRCPETEHVTFEHLVISPATAERIIKGSIEKLTKDELMCIAHIKQVTISPEPETVYHFLEKNYLFLGSEHIALMNDELLFCKNLDEVFERGLTSHAKIVALFVGSSDPRDSQPQGQQDSSKVNDAALALQEYFKKYPSDAKLVVGTVRDSSQQFTDAQNVADEDNTSTEDEDEVDLSRTRSRKRQSTALSTDNLATTSVSRKQKAARKRR
ncbi:hypothetical protein TWF730_004356 [Orbilia blumenaviensis]|uniref:Uncharacterized protein n=1 Tax=Orbilia blumenaviensis TaxID=1796055 RepID=A0AAV9U2B7_9PEZI